jgi:glycosyltransferase involved in cell wall biosynthesis
MRNKVSVLMTVFNCEKYLSKSISSILNQSFENFEFVIVDDFSTDKSKEIINKFNDKRIKSFSLNKKIGRTKALNYALKKCDCNLIAIQDADDISHPERIKTCLDKLNSDTTIGLIGSNFDYINCEGHKNLKQNKIIKFENRLQNLIFINSIPHSSIIFDRNAFENGTVYDENFIYAQDYCLILRYLKNSKVFLLEDKLINIRLHNQTMSSDKTLEKVRIKENIKLLNFSANNFKLNFYEKSKIYAYKMKNKIKLKILMGH